MMLYETYKPYRVESRNILSAANITTTTIYPFFSYCELA